MNISTSAASRRGRSGISLVEILTAVAVLSILATVSTMAVSHVNRNAQHRKLESDVKTLNSAIKAYVANGGSLGTISDPNAILSKLKTTRSKTDKTLHVGAPSGRMIDARVAAVAVPDDGGWKLRAKYNSASQQFDISATGAGVEFVLDETIAEASALVETRSHGPVKYSEKSTWIWDHASTANPKAPLGPSVFKTNPNVIDTSPTVAPVPVPVPPPAPGPVPVPIPPPPPLPRLPTPIFDKSSGSFPETQFPLPVTVVNIPAEIVAKTFYKLNSGPWTPYSGPVSVPMNSSLRAQFIAVDPTVNQNSYETYAYYYPVPENLTGTVTANFHSASGGPNLVYTITSSGDRFTHGDPIFILDGVPINSGDSNVLHFTGKPFSSIAPWQKFKLGDFFYHNGSSYYDSHATGVVLAITISLPDRSTTLKFDLKLDLVNTPNDPDDANASADYVKIMNLTQNIPLQINGVNYRIKLEFGATDSFGFASQSAFHVFEGATGQGELLGTFVPY